MNKLVRGFRECCRDLLDPEPTWQLIVLAAVVILVLTLMGCTAPDVRSVNGQDVDAPAGFVVYCQAHPERAECGGRP